MTIAILLAVGLVVSVVGLNFLVGSFEFFFGKPRLTFLKSRKGRNGFGFGFRWNTVKEPATFDRLQIVHYNPFANPSKIEIFRDFNKSSSAFAFDFDLGDSFQNMLASIENLNGKTSTVLIEVSSSTEGISHQYQMTSSKFIQKLNNAEYSEEEFSDKYLNKKVKVLYPTVKRSFVADPLPENAAKKLKLAVNPEFAGEFSGAAAGGDAPAVENFAVTKVWIEPGCIVCDACETIHPDVFDVQDATCIVRPGAPLADGLRIQEAAEACPVEVIKFSK